ncbi:MAG: hypothetical protein EAZ55_01175 [Cytophagales bacterium]|nr:MAG: hypothetical protein EAZ55_01175 [Cytophagales bacterium]
MKSSHYLLFFLGCLLFACTFEELSVETNAVQLSFSEDIIIFDTVLAGFRTTTQRLRVYNPSAKTIYIDYIGLKNATNSPFSLMIRGKKATTFSNVELLGRDSLLILVEATFANTLQSEINQRLDSLIFTQKDQTQTVLLLAWGQPVELIRQGSIAQNTFWSKNKPYVVMDSVVVQVGATLTIEDSARVFFFNQAYMQVYGNLKAVGQAQKWIQMRGFRQEAELSEQAGQWQGIRLAANSTAELQFVELKNAQTALWLQGKGIEATPSYQLRNVLIQNMTQYGIRADNADWYAENLLVNFCTQALVYCTQGGRSEIIHATLFNAEGRVSPSVVINDLKTVLQLKWTNTIVWGSRNEEFSLPTSNLSATWQHCLVKSLLTSVFEGNQNIRNTDPLFVDTKNRDFILKTNSPAIGKASEGSVSKDIRGKTRLSPKDIGAYESD